jgi:hypothetical protein
MRLFDIIRVPMPDAVLHLSLFMFKYSAATFGSMSCNNDIVGQCRRRLCSVNGSFCFVLFNVFQSFVV